MKQLYDVLHETKFDNLVNIAELVEDLPTIYCDMDMVLCDFLKGAKEVLGTDFPKADKRTKWPMISAKERLLGEFGMDAWCKENVVLY